MAQVRVLVADDNEGFGGLLGRFVSSHDGMEVVGLATSGVQAVAMASVLKPDVVLMDLYMPDLDGFEATRLVSAADPAVSVVAMTAHAGPDLEQRSLDAGARAFVRKPDAASRLIGVIRGIAPGADPCSGRESGPEDTPAPVS